MAVAPAGEGAQVFGQGVGRERAGGQHRDLIGTREAELLLAHHGDQGMVLQGRREGRAVAPAVHRQGAAGWHRVVIGGANHQ